ncbi:MAG TPA: hypothetical protein GX010_01465 [Erysipelotrichaceae bacterium]|nr:hypothetical protein [Erysipelotrichaceae bacterium]
MKIINVFKTHFDIGFTDLSENVIKEYSSTMLKDVLDFCEKTSSYPKGKRHVWTMSAWPLEQSLNRCTPELLSRAEKLIHNQQLVLHALPFTSHTESMSVNDMEHLFDCAKRICSKYNLSFPMSAKTTDVPGHTIALVKYLAKNGVRFLHMGCNPASIYPDVPMLFWWEDREGNRVLVFYNKTYGSTLLPPKDWKYPVWLSLQQTNDNVGPQPWSQIEQNEKEIKKAYPGAEVLFGSLDDFYCEIIKCDLSSLPVIKKDLGDTWIHGVATYPKEVGLIRRARNVAAKATFSEKDTLDFYENSLLFSEHTWGMDIKTHLTWKRSYPKELFLKERSSPRYQLVEKSWDEQRERAMNCVNIARKYGSLETKFVPINNQNIKVTIKNGKPFIAYAKTNREIIIDYQYGIVSTEEIYDFEKKYLTRLYEWAIADFGRQSYGEVDKKKYGIKLKKYYSDHNYSVFEYGVSKESYTLYGNCHSLIIKIGVDAEDRIQIIVKLNQKEATPYVEYGDLLFHTNCQGKEFIVKKLDYELNVMEDINKNANNILYCVSDKVAIDDISINPIDSPLVSFGSGAIYKFNGGVAKKRKPIFVFNLFNNMWGTNFPQWIEGDLSYEYIIKIK